MISRTAIIQNAHGIHCRPSALIAKELGSYEGEVTVACDGREENARNVLSLLSLGMACGQEITISVSGPEEETMCERMVELFQTHFDFPPA